MSEISLRVVTEPFVKASEDMQRRTNRATMWALRETARKMRSAARRGAPVYKGAGGVSVSKVRKARKAGVNLRGVALGKGELVEGSQVVAGLLRDSISSSRRLKEGMGGMFSLKLGPRGPRVHKYAGKAEARHRFMARAHAEISPQMGEIHARAWSRAMKR